MIDQMIGPEVRTQFTRALRAITVALIVIALALGVLAAVALYNVGTGHVTVEAGPGVRALLGNSILYQCVQSGALAAGSLIDAADIYAACHTDVDTILKAVIDISGDS